MGDRHAGEGGRARWVSIIYPFPPPPPPAVFADFLGWGGLARDRSLAEVACPNFWSLDESIHGSLLSCRVDSCHGPGIACVRAFCSGCFVSLDIERQVCRMFLPYFVPRGCCEICCVTKRVWYAVAGARYNLCGILRVGSKVKKGGC